jgi:hypothetical protein
MLSHRYGTFFGATKNITKFNNYFIFVQVHKNLSQFTDFSLPKLLSLSPQKYRVGIEYPGSLIRDPGSRGPKKGTGSRI